MTFSEKRSTDRKRFFERDVAERELPDEVVGAGRGELGFQELPNRVRTAGDPLAGGQDPVEVRRALVPGGAAPEPEQVVEAPVPDGIGPVGDAKRGGVVVGHHHETADADPGQGRVAVPVDFLPHLAEPVGEASRQRRGVQADDVEPTAGGPLGAFRRVDAVPEGRVGFLQRLQLHGHVLEVEELAGEVEGLPRQSLKDEIEALGVDALRLLRVLPEHGQFDGGGAAAEADVQPPAAHLVEHADLFDEPERMVERQRIDQRAEAKPPGPLGHRGQEHAG